jgi:hypothetical protein
MPNQIVSSVENNFSKGLVTEFSGLNFPENAATDTDNCIYTIVGDVTRRLGFDYEDNFILNNIAFDSNAMRLYKWNNVGGNGNTQIIVEQVGGIIHFYLSSSVTTSSSLSNNLMASTVDLTAFAASSFDSSIECQFSDGNGYLFVYHPSCDPIFCTFNATSNNITAQSIQIKIRDFTGLLETSTAVNQRPSTLTSVHFYNLLNQGWSSGNAWSAFSSTVVNIVGSAASPNPVTFTVATGLTGIVAGDLVRIVNNHDAFPGGSFVPAGSWIFSGTVTSYTSVTGALVVNIISYGGQLGANNSYGDWQINPINHGYIDTWHTAEGNYPSNADVWWYFKNSSGAFDPATTQQNTVLGISQAPQGHITLPAFDLNRSLATGISGLTSVTTVLRPSSGAWFQGRVWYTGVNASFFAAGNADFYTWSENIYFSQIVTSSADFGNCFQTNDPTSDKLNGLLPTDGGVITIQGCGNIYRLFPIQNGMLVFASNGVWFITGNRGIGFSADDYTITKISAVQSISATSFVDVNGLPFFWNEEAIYAVTPSQGGALTVEPLTVGTILTFYNNIPKSSKRFVRGSYNPLDYIIQWVFKDTEATDINDRYRFNRVLNYNTYNKSFYPYTIDNTDNSLSGIIYVNYPGGLVAPDPGFKYLTTKSSTGLFQITFSEEKDSSYTDWTSSTNPKDFNSFFITGYKLHGKGQFKFQLPYIYVFSKADGTPTSYYIQGRWDYATSGNSGRWSVAQLVNNWSSNFGMLFRKHKIRGRGLVLQLKFSSQTGKAFDIMGWSVYETVNTGI